MIIVNSKISSISIKSFETQSNQIIVVINKLRSPISILYSLYHFNLLFIKSIDFIGEGLVLDMIAKYIVE